jgi:hypothetical protein
MRTGIVVEVSAADRVRLEAVVADRNSPQKHVWRARIVLLTAESFGTAEIMRRTGRAKTAVWRWQERFMQAGVDCMVRAPSERWWTPAGTPIVDRSLETVAISDPPASRSDTRTVERARCPHAIRRADQPATPCRSVP